MRKSWSEKKLDEVCRIARGGSPRPIKKFLTDAKDGINWIKIGDATASSKYIYETKQKIKPEGIQRSRMVHAGDFLLSNSMSFGRPYIMRTSGCIHDGWLVLGDISDSVDQDYLYHFLGSPEAYLQFDARAAGSTVRNLNIDLVRSVELPLPSLPEQKRIVAILDEAFAGIDAAIANTEKNLANARELFESYLNAVFSHKGEGWGNKLLSDVCDNLDSKRVPITKAKRKGGEIPYYGASGIVDYVADHIFDEELLLVSEDGANLLARTYPIAFSVSGKTWVNNHAHVLRFDRLESQRFVEYYLNSISLEPYVSGMAQPKLNQRALNSIPIPFPKIEVQREVVEKMDELSAACSKVARIYQQKLVSLAELKQSLLQKAFSGELTANNVVPITAAKKPSVALDPDSPAFAAHIMATAYHWHEAQNRNKTFGRVKAQKTLHLFEALASIDMGRNAVKDAAGPNDRAHMRTAEQWAQDNDFFRFVQRRQGQRGYDFVKGNRYGEWLPQALEAIEPWRKTLDRVISLLMSLDTREAELVATVYAAWNNLLLDGSEPSEADIIFEARENWHPDKQQYSQAQFREAIGKLRRHGMVPDGSAKRVGGQESLL